MVKDQLLKLSRSWWQQARRSRMSDDLIWLPALGAVAYLLASRGGRLYPLESAFLLMLAAGLLVLAKAWWRWHRVGISSRLLQDRVHRLLLGEPLGGPLHEGVAESDQLLARAVDSLARSAQEQRAALADLQAAQLRDWQELDGVLAAIERSHANQRGTRLEVIERMQAIGKALQTALERTFNPGQIESNHRLRADQYRQQGQLFMDSLDQLCTGLDQFHNLLEELHDVFPRLRREEEALGRLADAGLRHGARLSLKVKGLAAQTPGLIEEGHARAEALRRFRLSADSVRDRVEGLARRIEGFRGEAQGRIRSFGSAQGSMRELDSVAQQAGLLAVNAAILAQQGGGGASLAAIGGHLKTLADQTTEGTSSLERALEQHQRNLEHETSGLWTLQEVTVGLLDDIRDLLRMVGEMDRQAQGLERGLEAHMGIVDQVQQASQQAELSLREIGERAAGFEAAHGRQWGVEAKLAPEQERLSRELSHLMELGENLSRVNLQNIDAIWGMLAQSQELRGSEPYRVVVSGELSKLLVSSTSDEEAWARLAWSRQQRKPRLLEAPTNPGLRGWPLGPDRFQLQLLGLDALGQPEPSAIAAWTSDPKGLRWSLHLHASLSGEDHRLSLLEGLLASSLKDCFPAVVVGLTPTGVEVGLPTPFPGFPVWLAGEALQLDFQDPSASIHPMTPWSHPRLVQHFLWAGPLGDQTTSRAALARVHHWVRDQVEHEGFLPSRPHPGPRPACPLRDLDDREVEAPLSVPFRCLGLGADVGSLASFRDRLLQAGAYPGNDGVTLCAVGLGDGHPTSLLLRLFQPDADLAGAFHPDLEPFQTRFREEVLAGETGDPYGAGWTLLEDLQRQGWVLPLPRVGP